MLNYGIIEEYNGELRVRVLVNNGDKDQAGSTPSKDLPSIVVNSREKDGYADGDTVIVGYVYNDISHPVVLFPYGDKTPTAGQRTDKTLKVEDVATLPQKTTVGAITGDELAFIKGLNYLLVEKIRQMEEKITELTKRTTTLSDTIDALTAEQ